MVALWLVTLLTLIMLATIPSAAHANEPARIAVALPLSGPQAALGHDIRAAVELALADHRRRSEGSGRSFVISWHDDQCSAAGGAAVATALATSGTPQPVAIVGHACPSAAHAAAAIYEAAGLLYLTAGSLPKRDANAPRLGARHYRLPAEGTQGQTIARELLAAGPTARIALIRDRTLYAQNALQPVAAALAAHRQPPVMVETFPGAEKDFAALAQRIKAAGISHIALSAFPSEAALLIDDVRKAAPHVVVMATDQLADPAFGRLAGQAGNGTMVTLPPDFSSYASAREAVVELKRQGNAPSRAALASYAAIQLIMAAAEAVDASSPDATASFLSSAVTPTILGAVTFDKDGAADIPAYVLLRWQDGVLRP